MVNEETTLQSLLRNRKIVRNYKDSELDFPQLSEVAEHAIKIPSAGFSRGIEIVHISEKENIVAIAKYSNEDSYVAKGFEKWISKSLSLFLIIINTKAYHDRYSQLDKKNATNSEDWSIPYWFVDAGASMMNCMLLIEEMGLKSGFLGSHNMDIENIKNHLSIPNDYLILGFVTAGVEKSTNVKKKNTKRKKLIHNEYFTK
ncbi:nitroreductase family protein [Candidatus Actinomarina sp.]|nr:nitroreductase family protein [Candidatus Actinomarina sp.]